MSDDLRELAEKATPGPWEFTEGYYAINRPERTFVYRVANANAMHDTRLIAAANPTAILALLDERDAALADLEAARVVYQMTREALSREAAKTERAEADLEAAREALRFYADRTNNATYYGPYDSISAWSRVHIDNGEIARAALGESA